MKSKYIGIAVLAWLLIFHAAGLHGSVAVVDGTRFDRTVDMQNSRLYLKGAALLRYLWIKEAYAGALYLPEGVQGSQALSDIPKHLVLEYRVDISAQDLAEATLNKIKSSLSGEAFQALLPKIETLNRLYRSVGPGDRYGLTYVPGIGTRLIYNGLTLGTIEGAAFAEALFAIWLGDDPIDEGFRDRLMGKL